MSLCFEDLHVGQVFRAGPHTIGLEAMQRFAAVNDPQYFHVDPEAATASLFGGLIGSGWQTAALTMSMLIAAARFSGGVVGAGADIEWRTPTRPGDSIEIEAEILELWPSRSQPDRGFAVLRIETRNQRGETIQIMRAKAMIFRRGSALAAAGPG